METLKAKVRNVSEGEKIHYIPVYRYQDSDYWSPVGGVYFDKESCRQTLYNSSWLGENVELKVIEVLLPVPTMICD